MIKDESGYQVSAWRAASHIYHSNGLGVKPEDYGSTQKQLNKMQGNLISYVQRGEPLPSIEHVRAYQSALVKNCEL
ncbi:MAG: hypothetical protein HC905_17965, partial [Bacteroidales bacterium]|nr:hypothetical protein [Bacteroidales bacterium]